MKMKNSVGFVNVVLPSCEKMEIGLSEKEHFDDVTNVTEQHHEEQEERAS